jgi:hypothetical protein
MMDGGFGKNANPAGLRLWWASEYSRAAEVFRARGAFFSHDFAIV